MRSFLMLSTLTVMTLFAAQETAQAADTFVPGDPCEQLGSTHMAADRTNLVICALKTGNTTNPNITCATGGGCEWKPLSGDDSGPHYYVTSVFGCRPGDSVIQYKTKAKTCANSGPVFGNVMANTMGIGGGSVTCGGTVCTTGAHDWSPSGNYAETCNYIEPGWETMYAGETSWPACTSTHVICQAETYTLCVSTKSMMQLLHEANGFSHDPSALLAAY